MSGRKERINPVELVEAAFQNPEFLQKMSTHIMRLDARGQILAAYDLEELAEDTRLPQQEDE